MLTLPKLLAVLLLVGNIVLADNVPTIHEVYQAAQAGRLDEAHRMVEQVLKAHPDSAKAHFVDAEILVRQGDVSDAKNEFETAQKLSPGLPFAKPHSVEDLKQRISGVSSNELMSNTMLPSTQSEHKSFPWIMILLGVAAVVFFVLVIRSLFSGKTNGYPSQGNGSYDAQRYPNPNGPYNPSGMGSGQPYPNQTGGGIGSGIASGLATGAAAGVGIVAGEALMHHFMDDSTSGNVANSSFVNNNTQPSNSMDDTDFGVTDSSSWDNEGMDDSSDNTW
ncbi:tetratricopeptide repeat protein [Sulfuricurvum sp.]|uniref:tetratricopeptide repeat protein n=1 Tax=Sulfuricurvum sp. TaxID=2025608 RepID=UPI00356B20FA